MRPLVDEVAKLRIEQLHREGEAARLAARTAAARPARPWRPRPLRPRLAIIGHRHGRRSTPAPTSVA